MKTKIILFCLLLAMSFNAQAQYVTIPDPFFANRLNMIVPSAMVGNQLDTSSLDVKSLTAMYVSADSIEDLEGIQYFIGLHSLDCSFNMITHIPALPDSLTDFNCRRNYLDSLPALPLNLRDLNCGINQIQFLPLLPDSLYTLDCNSNSLTTLPVLPLGLYSLICSGNPLAGMPVLPDSLYSIDCGMCTLTALPALPIALYQLNCLGNQLVSLPTLPASLGILNCEQNQLTSLPTLPSALTSLRCNFNQLPALPALPASLQYLQCANNLLPGLPTLPSSLMELYCYFNPMPALPTLPASLLVLDCHSDYLPSLPVLPVSLYDLNCSANQITALPVLNSGLFNLDCSNNLLTTIPTLPSGLNHLNCNSNPLLALPMLNASLSWLQCNNDGLDSLPALPASLNILECYANVLDSLPVLPGSLSSLYCQGNLLTSLPTLPVSLTHLDCSNNQITSLPVFPNGLIGLYCHNNQITCFNVFPFSIDQLSIGANPFTCLPNYIPAMDALTLTMPLCVDGDFVNNPHGCSGAEGVLGFTYLDQDSDCMKDSTDANYTNVPMKIYDASGNLLAQTYTASNGVYNFPQPLGTYTVAVDSTHLPFTPGCPDPGYDSTVSVTATDPLAADVNFNFVCKPGFDMGVRSIAHCGIVFPGQQHTLYVTAGDMSQWYNMHCGAGVSGMVKITVNGPVSYVGNAAGSLVPTVAGTNYIYSIADFGTVDMNTAFGLILMTDTLAVTGNDICIRVQVTPLSGDNDTTNNIMNLCYPVVNSHDPNIKEVYPGDVAPTYNGYFTYTVHFQNTGSAPAINIHVEDTLDSNLDLTTFELLDYSHANTTILNGNIITCRFPNIWLPDSTTDEQGSHGYFQYRIKMKQGLLLGTKIHNTAFIYFDYNSAVVTNTTENELVEPMPLSVSKVDSDTEIGVYPNPATDHLFVRCSVITEDMMLEVYNVTGQMVMQHKVVKQDSDLEISALAKGVYILKLFDGKNTSVQRFVKQ